MGLSWKPVRRGTVYCAPACGNGCSFASFKEAERGAKALAIRMGRGWKPHVWENLGWHYRAYLGLDEFRSSSVSPTGSGYWCSLYIGRQFMADNKDPRAAFRLALAAADVEIARWNRERQAIAKAMEAR